MLEIGTSGLMSGEGKRGVAARPKLPRLSSALPRWPDFCAFRLEGCALKKPAPSAREPRAVARSKGWRFHATARKWLLSTQFDRSATSENCEPVGEKRASSDSV